MNNTGSLEKRDASFLSVIAASLITVACLQWLPVLSFFFSVPLFVLYFSAEKKLFIYSVLFSFVINIIASVLSLLFQDISSISFVTILGVCMGSVFIILPVLCVLLPEKIRFRYRIVLSGIMSALCWTLFYIYTDAGSELIDLLHLLSDETAAMLYKMVPEGFERSAFSAKLTPEFLYSQVLNVLLYSLLPCCIAMYAIGCILGLRISGKLKTRVLPVFDMKFFYSDFNVFYLLVSGMIGIIIGRLLSNRFLTIVSWNAALSSGLFFILQGAGIIRFFTGLLQKKTGFKPVWLFFLIAVLLLFNGWPYFFGCLLIAGVVELFVPLRARYDNKDIIDPTPGRGSDQK